MHSYKHNTSKGRTGGKGSRNSNVFNSRNNLTVSGYKSQPMVAKYGDTIVTAGMGVAKQPYQQYGATLVDPWSYHSTRIPDLSCFETGCYTAQKEFLWTANCLASSSDTTVLLVELSNNPYYGFLQGAVGGVPGQPSAAPARAKMIAGTLSDRWSAARLVAAGVQVRFADNDSASAGQIVGSYLPAWRQNIPNPATSTYATWVTNPTNSRSFYSGPLRDGVRLTMRPADDYSLDLLDTSSNNSSQGTFLVTIQGLVATQSRQLNVSIIAHYEGLVQDNTYGEIPLAMVIDTRSQNFGVALGAEVPNTCSATEAAIREQKKAVNKAIQGDGPTLKRVKRLK